MAKVKICGITNTEDAMLAAGLGAWAIGFIFYSKSPRYITPEKAQEISQKIKEYGTKTIGVFVNEKPEIINEIAEIVKLDYVQLHGNETVEDCEKLNIPFIKTIRDINETGIYSNAIAFLVDAVDTENWGGTGKLADWEFAKSLKKHNILILSGGLSSDNIEKVLHVVKPDFVDLSSSLEISPGKKNHKLMREFFEKIKNKETKINE